MKRGSNAAQKMLGRAKRYGPLYGFLMLWVAIFTAFATIDPSGTPLESARREISVAAYGGIVVCAVIGLSTFFHPLLQRPSQWLRSHLLQVFGFLTLALLVLSIYLSLPLASIALALGFLISGLGIGAGLCLVPARAIREPSPIVEQAASESDLESLRERFRELTSLRHRLNILLPRVRDRLRRDKSQFGEPLLVTPGCREDYAQLLEAYRMWKVRTKKLVNECAPEYDDKFTNAVQMMDHPLYLRRRYCISAYQWFDTIKKALDDISFLMKELGKELTVSIASELPYDFMEHFYDPSTEWQAASPGHIRLIEKAECSSVAHPAIFEHPPEEGDAILTYHLCGLPPPPAKFQLSFHYGVVDKLYEEPSGALIEESDFLSVAGNQVIFLIKIDRKEILRSPQLGHEWSPLIERGPFEALNSNLTIEFRTNAMGEPRGNWAAWGEPRLVEVKPTSSAAG